MQVTVRKIGNSEGIIIPKELLDSAGLKAGDRLELVRDGDTIRLTPDKATLDFARKMEIARARMKKYEVALRELAK